MKSFFLDDKDPLLHIVYAAMPSGHITQKWRRY